MKFEIRTFETIDSTNDEAIKLAKHGAPEGSCVIARQQTAGRGRHGRQWVSDLDSGLYFSVILRPSVDPAHLSLITLMSGVAACDALSDLGVKPDIKWVNDLLVNEKKIGGILAEAVETPAGLAVIVGIGINLTSDNFSADLAKTATSIEAETGKRVTQLAFAHALTDHLAQCYESFCNEGSAKIVEMWRIRSSYFSGKPVRVILAGSVIEGVTDGLETNGALRLRSSDGSLIVVQAGDVERLRKF